MLYSCVPYIRLSQGKLLFYELIEPSPRSGNVNQKSKKNLSDNKTSGVLSKSAMKRLSNNIDLWTTSLEVKRLKHNYPKSFYNSKITFVTLTLSAPQFHSDLDIKRLMLNPFLTTLKKTKSIQVFIWVAEKQMNKNIHFHILVDRFIDWHYILKIWNNQQKKLGYIDAYRQNQIEKHKNGMYIDREKLDKWHFCKQIKAYQKGKTENWSNPNSTDIHKIDKVKNIRGYMTKYLTKGFEDKVKKFSAPLIKPDYCHLRKRFIIAQKRKELKEHLKVEGRLYGRSDLFQLVDFFYLNDLSYNQPVLNKIINANLYNYFSNDYCAILSDVDFSSIKKNHPVFYSPIEDHYLKIFNSLYK